MRRLGLRATFFASFALLAVVPILGLGFYEANRIESAEVARTESAMTFAALALARQVGQVVESHSRVVTLLAGQVSLLPRFAAKALLPILEAYRRRFGGFSTLQVADNRGNTIAAAPAGEPSLATPEALARRRLVITPVRRIRNEAAIGIGTPVLGRDGDLRGFVGAALPTTVFQALVTQVVSEFRGAKAVLLDDRGRVVAHPEERRRESIASLGELVLYRPTTSPRGEVRIGKDEQSERVRAALSPIRTFGLRWTAVVSQPESKIQAVGRSARLQAMAAAGLALLMALVLAALIAAWLARPIARLAAWAVRVGRGNGEPDRPNGALQRWQPEEVAELTDATQDMVAQLRSAQREVEAIVEERTAQLRREIDERRRAEVALREREEHLRLVVRATNDAVWTWYLDRDEIQWNEALETLFGYSPARVDPQPSWRAQQIDPQDRDRVLRGLQTAIERGDASWSDEYRFRRADGGWSLVVDRAYIQRDEEGRPSMAIGAMTDVTKRREVEERLRQAQKMEAIGRLAGGVAHDFNNLLVSIIGFSELMLDTMDTGDPRRPDLAEIHRAGKQAASLTRQLLVFSRREPAQVTVVDLNAIVAGMEKMLRRIIGEHLSLRTELEPNLGRLQVDPAQLEQVILNLAVNARDAMPSGGSVVIRTANAENAEIGHAVCLSVADTGVGMDEETQQRIFEPFFTTKAAGKGTGLGLSIVYGVVEQCGGRISIHSAPGAGTRFDLYFPRADQVGVITTSEQQEEAAGGNEVILVAEDEDAVRTFAVRVLRERGYHVLEAEDGEEALRQAERSEAVVDLLVTDMVMPGMSGVELAERLQRARPEIAILYISGYSEEMEAARAASPRDERFLQKPFSARELALRVRNILDQS